jgi:hypothetical protein
MVFNITFNHIWAILLQSVFFGGGNRSTWRKPLQATDKLSDKVVSSTPHHEQDSNSQH